MIHALSRLARASSLSLAVAVSLLSAPALAAGPQSTLDDVSRAVTRTLGGGALAMGGGLLAGSGGVMVGVTAPAIAAEAVLGGGFVVTSLVAVNTVLAVATGVAVVGIGLAAIGAGGYLIWRAFHPDPTVVTREQFLAARPPALVTHAPIVIDLSQYRGDGTSVTHAPIVIDLSEYRGSNADRDERTRTGAGEAIPGTVSGAIGAGMSR